MWGSVQPYGLKSECREASWREQAADTLVETYGFRHGVAEDCYMLGYYAASNENLLSTFRDNILVSSSREKY